VTEIHARDPRSIPTARRPDVAAGAALLAAVLAAIPLVLSRLDGDADLDPFFAALVVAALVVAAIAARPTAGHQVRLVGRRHALAWIGVAVWAAVLLGMYQSACACSTPDPSGLPPVATYLGLPATAFHLLATYGGGLLVAFAALRPAPSAEPDAPPG
jgi:drug/metabolite transporter (DMT)-like permease